MVFAGQRHTGEITGQVCRCYLKFCCIRAEEGNQGGKEHSRCRFSGAGFRLGTVHKPIDYQRDRLENNIGNPVRDVANDGNKGKSPKGVEGYPRNCTRAGEVIKSRFYVNFCSFLHLTIICGNIL